MSPANEVQVGKQRKADHPPVKQEMSDRHTNMKGRWLRLCCVLGLMLGGRGVVAADDRPNLLFFFTEDQSPHMSFLGTEGLETPNMDRIAQQGVYFHRAFVQYPVCSPSKGNLFTGLSATTNGIRANTINIFKPAEAVTESDRRHPLYDRLRIADQYPTLIEILREQGYYLGVTHKLHVLPNEKFPYHEWMRRPTKDDLKRFIQEAQKRDQPFFLFYNIPQPHRPFPNSDQRSISVDPNEVSLPPLLPDDAVGRQDWAEYLANIEVADRSIGLGLEALEETGMTAKTIIFFAGDHGPAYHRAKMSLYDFGVRVPLAVAGPGIRRAVETHELISFLDLMPTILEMVGGPKPELAHGHSVLPFLRGQSETTGRDYVFAEVQHNAQTRDDGMQERMVFDGRYRLIYREGRSKPRTVNDDLRSWQPWRNRVYSHIVENRERYPDAYRLLAEIDNGRLEGAGKLPRLELYDWANDLWDLKNLAADPQHRETLDRLGRVLHDWLVEIDDRHITPAKIREPAQY